MWNMFTLECCRVPFRVRSTVKRGYIRCVSCTALCFGHAVRPAWQTWAALRNWILKNHYLKTIKNIPQIFLGPFRRRTELHSGASGRDIGHPPVGIFLARIFVLQKKKKWKPWILNTSVETLSALSCFNFPSRDVQDSRNMQINICAKIL